MDMPSQDYVNISRDYHNPKENVLSYVRGLYPSAYISSFQTTTGDDCGEMGVAVIGLELKDSKTGKVTRQDRYKLEWSSVSQGTFATEPIPLGTLQRVMLATRRLMLGKRL